jgi:biopolymer transport protein ExbD
VLTLFIIWTEMVVSVSLERVVGFPIHVVRPGVTAARSPGIQPLRVSVRGVSQNPRLFVDFQPVAWEDFSALLKKELARRPPDWPVYVEGDPDLEWRQVAEAIDAVRGQHAQVALLPSAAKRQ